MTLDQLTEQYKTQIAVIRYHIWWPSSKDPYYQYNPEEATARNNFYANQYAPHLFIEGSDYGSEYEQWETAFLQRMGISSDWFFSVGGDYNPDNRNLHLDIDIFLENENPEGVEFLRIALVENNIFWQAPNGVDWHNQVFRDMIPDPNGVEITPDNSGVFQTEVDFTIGEEIVLENAELVLFIQSTRDKEILQGYKAALSDFEINSIDDSQNKPINKAELFNYPNPFNSSTEIKFFLPHNGQVKLEIYNLIGERIATPLNDKLSAGEHSVLFRADNYSTGVYFCKLSYGKLNLISKMVCIK